MEPLLRSPNLGRDAGNDVRLEIPFQQLYNRKIVPSCPKHVDPIRPAGFNKDLFGEGVDFVRGNLSRICKGNVESFHGRDLEAAVFEELGELAVQIVFEIGDPHQPSNA